jgi:hypothetical protein
MIPYTLNRLLEGFRRTAIENSFAIVTDLLALLGKE